MSKKTKFTGLLMLGLLVASLFAVATVGATVLGQVKFVETGTSNDVSWSTVDASVDIQVTDADFIDTVSGSTLTVKVTTSSDATGCPAITLTEAGDTGVFTGAITFKGTTTCGSNELKVSDGDSVTVNYTDTDPAFTVADILTIELAGPSITGLQPAHGTVTRAVTQTFVADITDGQSGVDDTTIKFVFGTTEVSPSSTTAITNGVRAQVILGLAEGDTDWTVKASDIAGNHTIFDRDTTTPSVQDDYRITVDLTRPVLLKAVTGDSYDTSTKDVSTSDKNTSIRVEFTEADRLNGDTLQPNDFLVGGAIPTAAQYFGNVDGASTIVQDSVFLTVPAMASNATPAVQYVGSVEDRAGNAALTAFLDAQDGLAPGLSVSVDTSLSQDDVKVTVSTDEAVKTGTTPSVDPDPRAAVTDPGASSTVATSSPNVFEVTLSIVAGNDSGYDVVVQATDNSLLSNTTSKTFNVAPDGSLFEIDTALPALVLTTDVSPASGAAVEQQSPLFISIDWTAETGEYTGDTHGTVTLTEATLDDMAITFSTSDNKKFIYAVTDIALGDHEVSITGEDDAGNERTHTYEFTVVERSAYEVPLFPGMNLVSLPGDPLDDSLASVLADTSVDMVVTYDPADPAGPWLVAELVGGVWSGTLSSMNGAHGYWVRSASFDPIETDIPVTGFSQLLPTITLVPGWNLIPVIDLATRTAGTEIIGYFDNAPITVAYTYSPTASAWEKKTKAHTGMAYWVWASSSGTLTPS